MASPGAAGPTNLTVQPDQRRDLASMSQAGNYGGYGNGGLAGGNYRWRCCGASLSNGAG
ncbi:hypothetical protein QP162_20355 [Sphingomonas aurantiaca]|uniref:hypothetical protein n=1 Tax=Sphingomonas aurantiaca TaxID=185949 RepID=UPI002FE335B2